MNLDPTHQAAIKALRNWFLAEQRDLPWRVDRTPYAVWVSEVMLQQTQVAVVIPYFLRWMELFPSIKALAEAPIEDVIKAWEGLGYYSRARNLHAGARFIVEKYAGCFPDHPDSIRLIKGIGEYTANAIRSFAFHHPVMALDGNVMRVLARYFRIEEDIGKIKIIREMREKGNSLLPEQEPWVISEAVIELGATVCQRTPNCSICPLKTSCRGFLEGVADQLPVKARNVTTEKLYRAVVVLRAGECWLVRQCPQGEIMSGLHEFPYFETSQNGLSAGELGKQIADRFGLAVRWEKSLKPVAHSFTRFRVELKPQLFVIESRELPVIDEHHTWLTCEQLHERAFSSGHRRILQAIFESN